MAQEDVNLLNAYCVVVVVVQIPGSRMQPILDGQVSKSSNEAHKNRFYILLLSTILFATSTYPVPVRPGGTAVQLNDCVGSPSRGGGTCEAMRESNLGPVNSWRYPVNRSIVFDFDGEI